MKYLVIFLVLIGLTGLATIPSSYALILGYPMEFWESADIILDGTVISTTKIDSQKLVQHNIKVNQYFKNQKPQQMITAYGPDIYNEKWFYPKFFKQGDRVLFYLKKIDDKYMILEHSIVATEKCDPRDMIGLSTLPGEPIGRGGPTLFFDPYQTCNGYFYPVDFLSSMLSPVKQLKAGIHLEDVECKESLTLVTKYDDSLACVTYDTRTKLIKHGWAKNSLYTLDDKTIIENVNNLDEVKAFLAKYPNTNYGVQRDSWNVYYSIDGIISETPEHSNSRTKRIIIEIDPFGRPLRVGIECGGPVTLSAQSNVIFLLNTPNWCFPDGNEIKSLKKDDLVIPRGDLFLQPLRIEGLNETYSVGEKIEFTIKFDGIWNGCGVPRLKIEDINHQQIWEGGLVVSLCDPDMKKDHIKKEWTVDDNSNLGVPSIDKAGFYTLFVTYGDDIIQKNFVVRW